MNEDKTPTPPETGEKLDPYLIEKRKQIKILGTWSEQLKLWGEWLLVTTVGVALSQFIALEIAGDVDMVILFFLLLLAGSFIGGTALGLLQWLALRRRIDKVRPRISVIAWVVGTAIGMVFVTNSIEPASSSVGSAAVGGALMGLAYCLVLYRETKTAIWWIPASTIAWSVAFHIGIPVYEYYDLLGYLLVIGIINGLVTGIAYVFSFTKTRLNVLDRLSLIGFGALLISGIWLLFTLPFNQPGPGQLLWPTTTPMPTDTAAPTETLEGSTPIDTLGEGTPIGTLEGEPAVPANPADRNNMYSEPPEMQIDPSKTYIAIIETEKGEIVIELFADRIPQTVNNFVFLARQGFYDDTTFHRVEPGFVIQGGDPLGTGTGGPGYTVPAEIELLHTQGAIATARQGDQINPERASSGSQFYIALEPLPQLDGSYTVFGQVIEGMDIVQSIAIGDVIERIIITMK